MTDEHTLPGEDQKERQTEKIDQPRSVLPTVPGFQLVRKLGQGGMGEVYEANQIEPVRRRVAIKLIRPGMEGEDVLHRFAVERQALALMDHPNIARVFDAGTTPDGRPYFVMEYVAGIPIDRYCDEHRLETRKRLELFLTVCGGVQHAHHKGIIHRDLKPANILISMQDGNPVPKIIDFGVARATAGFLFGDSSRTLIGDLLGTPDYMSPEQADLSTLDIDTRSDVYSLGVVFYELLVGARPFDAKTLRSGGFDEMRRLIREKDPPRPSTRFLSLGEASTVSARNRQTEPRNLIRELSGDLDWITMKALEKDRTRRYNSPSDMADDILRFLRSEPIFARPPSAMYRFSRFVRRHTVGVAAGFIVVLAIIAGVAGMTVGLVKAQRAERKAEQEAEAARQVSDFLVSLFEVSQPGESMGETITAREILDRGVESIQVELTDQPLVQARLMDTMGIVYKSLGLYEKAESLYTASLEIREDNLPENHPDVATSLNHLGLFYDGQGKYEEAEPLYKRALTIRTEVLGKDHGEVALMWNNLGLLYWHQGLYEKVGPCYEEALKIWEKVEKPDQAKIAMVLNNLASLRYKEGNYSEAVSFFTRALGIREKLLGENHPDVANALNNLATVHFILGEYKETEKLLLRSQAIREKVYGPNHPEIALGLRNLAVFYKKRGEYEKAEPLLLKALEIRKATLPEDHPDIASALASLANLYNDLNDPAKAEPLFREAITMQEKVLGSEHPDLAPNLRDLAVCLTKRERYGEAEKLFERALSIQEKVRGNDHPAIAGILKGMAALYVNQERYQEAETLYKRAISILEAKFKPDHPDLVAMKTSYADLLRKTGRETEAREIEKQGK
ncbi:MAG TPA: serine/threonine-protein kinase [Thermoanaerobaculia bacterium]|nr:serine/threonine-protein kinase [Thermoanaerobaculia bacterium]HUM29054.1 serine/threonine-protein kinase [Thermoanaerobaculia bacterium]HXK67390.1 serine/threonine-protein kinase [Thermoanaerobaculia bacterium]